MNKLKLILLAVAAAAICQSAHALSGVGQNGGDLRYPRNHADLTLIPMKMK